MTSVMSYKNALAFYLNEQSCKRNETEKKIEKKGREKSLPGAPPGPPAGPAQLPLQRAAWLGQAGRQVLDGARAARHAAARRLASPPRRPGGMDRTSTTSSNPRHLRFSPAPLLRSPRTVADAAVIAPS